MRVKWNDTLEDRFWARVNKDGPLVVVLLGSCWQWTGSRDRKGYGSLIPKKKREKAHRVSWRIHNGPIPIKLNVLHRCDNTSCVNPKHLFLGTHLDNQKDKVQKGRQAIGERHGRSKLTSEKVREIRRRHEPFCKTNGTNPLSREFSITTKTLLNIVDMKIWKHVKIES